MSGETRSDLERQLVELGRSHPDSAVYAVDRRGAQFVDLPAFIQNEFAWVLSADSPVELMAVPFRQNGIEIFSACQNSETGTAVGPVRLADEPNRTVELHLFDLGEYLVGAVIDPNARIATQPEAPVATPKPVPGAEAPAPEPAASAVATSKPAATPKPLATPVTPKPMAPPVTPVTPEPAAPPVTPIPAMPAAVPAAADPPPAPPAPVTPAPAARAESSPPISPTAPQTPSPPVAVPAPSVTPPAPQTPSASAAAAEVVSRTVLAPPPSPPTRPATLPTPDASTADQEDAADPIDASSIYEEDARADAIQPYLDSDPVIEVAAPAAAVAVAPTPAVEEIAEPPTIASPEEVDLRDGGDLTSSDIPAAAVPAVPAVIGGTAATADMGQPNPASDDEMHLDARRRVLDVGPVVEDQLGWPHYDLAGRPITDFMHPDDIEDGLQSWFEMVGTAGATRVIRNRYWHREGEWRWFDQTDVNLLHDPATQAIVTRFVDVTGEMDGYQPPSVPAQAPDPDVPVASGDLDAGPMTGGGAVIDEAMPDGAANAAEAAASTLVAPTQPVDVPPMMDPAATGVVAGGVAAAAATARVVDGGSDTSNRSADSTEIDREAARRRWTAVYDDARPVGAALIHVDERGGTVHADPEWFDLTGMTRGTGIRDLRNVIRQRDGFDAAVTRALEHGEPTDLHVRARNRDLDLQFRPRQMDDGRPSVMVLGRPMPTAGAAAAAPAPAIPVAPVAPAAPSAPVAPVAREVRTAPVAPVAPVVRTAPVAPSAPEVRTTPVAPSAPVGPSAPVAPSAPAAPVAPQVRTTPANAPLTVQPTAPSPTVPPAPLDPAPGVERTVPVDSVTARQDGLDRLYGNLQPSQVRKERRSRHFTWRHAVALLAILAVAAGLRLWDITSLPSGLSGTEAVAGIEGDRVLNDGWIGIYSNLDHGRPAAPYYATAASVAVLGETTLAVRIVSVIVGLATVAALYFIARRFYGSRVAFGAAAALALTTVHIHFSRVGFTDIWWPLLGVLAVSATAMALHKKSASRAVIAGVLAGAGVYFSDGHWVYLLALGVGLLFWVFGRPNRERIAVAGTTAVVAGLTALPMGLWLRRNTGDGIFRMGDTASSEWSEASLGGKAELLSRWYLESWDTLLFDPVEDLTNGTGLVAALPIVLLIGAILGLVWMLFNHRSAFSWLVVCLLLVVPLGQAISNDAEIDRMFVLTPLIALLFGIAWGGLYEATRDRVGSWVAGLAGGAILAAVAFLSITSYFDSFRNSTGQAWQFNTALTNAIDVVNDQPGEPYVNLISDRYDYDYAVPQYLLADNDGRDLDSGYELADVDTDQVFVITGTEVPETVEDLGARYPTGETLAIHTDSTQPYAVFLVEN